MLKEHNRLKHMQKLPPRLIRYGKTLNRHDLVKIVAILLMVIDHIGEFYFPEAPLWRAFGRGAAPLFFFLIGFSGKLNVTFSLLFYGLILSATGSLLFHNLYINVLINLVFIQCLMKWRFFNDLSTLERGLLFSSCFLMNIFVALYIEYGLFSVLFALSARLLAIHDPQAKYWMSLTWGLYFITQCVYFDFIQNILSMSCFFILSITLMYFMFHYKLKTVKTPRIFITISLLLSRYSLEVYFYHLLALQSLAFLGLTNAYTPV